VQRATDGTIIVSATDLVGYLACDHLTTLELGRVDGLWERPPRREDPTVQLLQDRGDAHELAYLEGLRARGLSVVEIDKDQLTTPGALRAAQATTLAAMRAGVDVIYQATFFDGRWRGHADFLIRVERPSPLLGAWSYEIADTKLSRGVKAAAILQLCVYADLLTALQGIAPERVHIVTGDLIEHAHRLADYAAYYRLVKSRFEARVLGERDIVRQPLPTYPDPVDHCKVCVWYPRCIQRRRDDDHLSLVAGMRRVDTERLLDGGVRTLAELARLPVGRAVGEMNSRVLDRLRDQARLQLHEREAGDRVYELIPPDPSDPGRGLAALPEPTPWDMFVDIEGTPGRLTMASSISSGWSSKRMGPPSTGRSGVTTGRARRSPSRR
jgi:predicted RecB family nuclease